MRFCNFDLIVEAKRAKDCSQNRVQWQEEVAAYGTVYGRENVPVRMIALGGIWNAEDDDVPFNTSHCPVHMCQWSTLLLECQRLKRQFEERMKADPSSQILADLRILDDLICIFEVLRYPALKLFDDFDFSANLLDLGCVKWIQQRFQDVSQEFESLL